MGPRRGAHRAARLVSCVVTCCSSIIYSVLREIDGAVLSSYAPAVAACLLYTYSCSSLGVLCNARVLYAFSVRHRIRMERTGGILSG